MHNTVVVTAITRDHYCGTAADLAQTAHDLAGFRAIAVAMSGLIDVRSHDSRLCANRRFVPLVYREWSEWKPSALCPSSTADEQQNTSVASCAWVCSYRLTWKLKFLAIHEIVRSGLHALALDADRRFVGNPLPFFDLLGAHGFEVIARSDQGREGAILLNVGCLLVRSSERSVELVSRVANRSTVAWDQIVFNEELNFSSVPVCDLRAYNLRAEWFQTELHMDQIRQKALANLGFEPDYGSRGECSDISTRRRALSPPDGSTLWEHWHPHRLNSPQQRKTCQRCIERQCVDYLRMPGDQKLESGAAVVATAAAELLKRSPRATVDAWSLTNTTMVAGGAQGMRIAPFQTRPLWSCSQCGEPYWARGSARNRTKLTVQPTRPQ